MDVTIGLTCEELEKVLEEAGIKGDAAVSADVMRKAIAKTISENNASIVMQLLEMMGKLQIETLMKQFMK
jgi:hypothetical protein